MSQYLPRFLTCVRVLQWVMLFAGMVSFEGESFDKAAYFVACAVFWHLYADWLERSESNESKEAE